jgi:hypothetical protein
MVKGHINHQFVDATPTHSAPASKYADPNAYSGCLDIDEFRESRKFVAIAALNRALCDILCECPRGADLRAS